MTKRILIALAAALAVLGLTAAPALAYSAPVGLSFPTGKVTVATGALPSNQRVTVYSTNPAWCESTTIRYLIPGGAWTIFTDAGDGSVTCSSKGTTLVTLARLPKGSRIAITQPYTGKRTAITGHLTVRNLNGTASYVTYRAT